jgi:hypothetical protein
MSAQNTIVHMFHYKNTTVDNQAMRNCTRNIVLDSLPHGPENFHFHNPHQDACVRLLADDAARVTEILYGVHGSGPERIRALPYGLTTWVLSELQA